MGNPETITAPDLAHGRPILETWPTLSPEATAERLARVGLGDPFVWCRTPDELSVGQKQRYALALSLASSGSFLMIDEWLSGLDDLTARAVAWATGKALRQAGKGALLICTRPELAHDLSPDCHIHMGYQSQPTITWAGGTLGCCSILPSLIIGPGTRKDWHALKPLHYAAGDPATVDTITVARLPNDPAPVAVAVMSYPDLQSAARTIATAGAYAVRSQAEAQRLNRDFRRLSRVVVVPELRGAGIAQALLAHVAEQCGVRYIECTTAMGRYSRFLEKLGFREVPSTPTDAEAALVDWARRCCIDPRLVLDPEGFPAALDRLSVRNAREGRRLIWATFHALVLYRRSRRRPPKTIPGPKCHHWPEAFDVAARRLSDRPSYWLLGPLDPLTGCSDNPLSE